MTRRAVFPSPPADPPTLRQAPERRGPPPLPAVLSPWPRARARVFSLELRWAGLPSAYTTVRAATEAEAEASIDDAGLLAAARLGRRYPDAVVLHDDAGTKAEHVRRMRAASECRATEAV